MEDQERIKQNISKNIALYRKSKGLTQAELAEKLNYSDKSVSKWERGDGLPDSMTLRDLANFFGCSVDDFYKDEIVVKKEHHTSMKKHTIIPLLAIGIAWIVVCTVFFLVSVFASESSFQAWLLFIYGIIITGILCVVFSAIYHNKELILASETVIIWGVALSAFLTVITLAPDVQNMWLIFIVAIPVELIAVLYYILKSDKPFIRKIFSRKKKEK